MGFHTIYIYICSVCMLKILTMRILRDERLKTTLHIFGMMNPNPIEESRKKSYRSDMYYMYIYIYISYLDNIYIYTLTHTYITHIISIIPYSNFKDIHRCKDLNLKTSLFLWGGLPVRTEAEMGWDDVEATSSWVFHGDGRLPSGNQTWLAGRGPLWTVIFLLKKTPLMEDFSACHV